MVAAVCVRQGLPFLAEGLATYGAMQVVKDFRGDEQLRRYASFMRQPYPYAPMRRGEPLLRAIDPYTARRRGPFAMWALNQTVGEARINGAIRRLIEAHEQPGAPAVTTLDLYRELKAVTPPESQPLLHDLFEVNTFWQLKAVRSSSRQTRRHGEVTLDVKARKVVYDAAGVEKEVPMNELVDVGVFAAAEQGHETFSAPLHVAKQRIHSGVQTITITVSRKPLLAGIDPYHLLDWEEREDDDNVARIGAR